MNAECPHRIDTGAYLLDGLDAGEGEEFVRHLAGCDRCRAEVDALVPVARLLAALAAPRTRPR